MSALAALLIGMIISGVVRYFSDREARSKFARRIINSPLPITNATIGSVAIIGFFLGVLFRPLGQVSIGFGEVTLPLWQACGIVSALWVIVYLTSSDINASNDD